MRTGEVPDMGMSPRARVRLRIMLELSPLSGLDFGSEEVMLAVARVCSDLMRDFSHDDPPEAMLDGMREVVIDTVDEELDSLVRMHKGRGNG